MQTLSQHRYIIWQILIHELTVALLSKKIICKQEG